MLHELTIHWITANPIWWNNFHQPFLFNWTFSKLSCYYFHIWFTKKRKQFVHRFHYYTESLLYTYSGNANSQFGTNLFLPISPNVCSKPVCCDMRCHTSLALILAACVLAILHFSSLVIYYGAVILFLKYLSIPPNHSVPSPGPSNKCQITVLTLEKKNRYYKKGQVR